MKRTFVLALALVLLLAVGVLAAPPIKRGPQNDSASVSFTINILPYAEVKLDENKLFRGDILGRVGLYTSDEWQVLANAKTHFADIVGREITDDDVIFEDRNGGALFSVESNYDFNIKVTLDEMDANLLSPYVFFVYEHWGSYNPVIDKDAQKSKLTQPGDEVEFVHRFVQNASSQYKIGGGLWISQISEQQANEYSGLITITIGAPVGAEE